VLKGIAAYLGVAVVLALTAHAQPQATAIVSGASTHKLTRADGSSITFYLDKSYPPWQAGELLIVIQGSDCNSVKHIKAIPQHLRRARPGADLLTVEKYGIEANLPYEDEVNRTDCPAAYLRHDSPSQRAQDLDAVLASVLRAHAYRRVIVIGGSEGAVVAHLLAATSPHISATIAFNGGGQWFMQDLLHSVRSDTTSEVQIALAEQGVRELVHEIQTEAAKDMVVSGHGYLWWRELLELDQLAVLTQVSAPTLIMQSERDTSVSPSAVLTMVAKLHMSGRHNIHYRSYPELDHRLSAPDGNSRMSEVVEDMAVWLTHILGE
jgi:alpha/beta superfamily hydrolase